MVKTILSQKNDGLQKKEVPNRLENKNSIEVPLPKIEVTIGGEIKRLKKIK